MFRRIGEYISLDLFYFVNLTNSCSLISRALFSVIAVISERSIVEVHIGTKELSHQVSSHYVQRVNAGSSAKSLVELTQTDRQTNRQRLFFIYNNLKMLSSECLLQTSCQSIHKGKDTVTMKHSLSCFQVLRS